jgi:hypothetical protein
MEVTSPSISSVFHIEGTFPDTSGCLSTPEPFDDFIVFRHQTVVHAGTVIIEFFYDRHDLNSFAVINFTIAGKSRYFSVKKPVISP